MKKISTAFSLLLLLTGCLHQPAPSRPAEAPAASTMTQSQIFFGRMQPKRKEVTDKEWQTFSQKIAGCFPLGYTIIDGNGYWRRKNGEVDHERSKVLLAVYADTAEKRRCIENLKQDYKKRFQQEAVLEVRSEATASF